MRDLDWAIREAQRLGYGVHYGRYMADHPNTADHSVELTPDPEDDDPPVRCKHCGKPFKPHDGHQVFCTEKCRLDRRRLLNRLGKRNAEKHSFGEEVCPVCKKTFEKPAPKQIYCGRSCASVVRNRTRKKKV